MAGTKGHSGGKRKGSGRKPKAPVDYDLKFKKSILKAARKLAKKYDKPIEECALEMFYNEKTQDAVRASIWKSYMELFVVKKTSSDVNATVSGFEPPRTYLPERMPDPAEDIGDDSV